MKKFSFDLSAQSESKKIILVRELPTFLKSTKALIYLAAFTATFLFAGCRKQGANEPTAQTTTDAAVESDNDNNAILADKEYLRGFHGFHFQTLWELAQARLATAKYRRFSKAVEDGYEDINVIMPNMGYHFMKSPIVDSVFEVRKPEILVYNKRPDGTFELVAIEYAVPISLTPDKAPEGFTGPADVWDRNTDFGLWLLHAWIWKRNPDGVFNPTNPDVHVR